MYIQMLVLFTSRQKQGNILARMHTLYTFDWCHGKKSAYLSDSCNSM